MKTLTFDAYFHRIKEHRTAQDLGIPEGYDTPMSFFMKNQVTPTEDQVHLLIDALDQLSIPHDIERPKKTINRNEYVEASLSLVVNFLKKHGSSQLELSRVMGIHQPNMSAACKYGRIKRGLIEDAFVCAKNMVHPKYEAELARVYERTMEGEDEPISRVPVARKSKSITGHEKLKEVMAQHRYKISDLSKVLSISPGRTGQYLNNVSPVTESMHERIMEALEKMMAGNKDALRDLRKAEKEMLDAQEDA